MIAREGESRLDGALGHLPVVLGEARQVEPVKPRLDGGEILDGLAQTLRGIGALAFQRERCRPSPARVELDAHRRLETLALLTVVELGRLVASRGSPR